MAKKPFNIQIFDGPFDKHWVRREQKNMAKKLLTPRGYLSHTQISMWRTNRELYIRNYMLGDDKRFTNNGMAFGSRVSQALENGSDGTDIAMEALVALLPHYSKREHQIRVPLAVAGWEVDMLGKLDTFDEAKLRVREYKTARKMWTEAQVKKHLQLHHYATMIKLKYGKLPSECWLDCVKTELVDGEVELTGEVKHFKVEIGMVEVLKYMALTMQVAKEIDVEYRKQLAKLA